MQGRRPIRALGGPVDDVQSICGMQIRRIAVAALLAAGCVTETHRTIQPVAAESLGPLSSRASYTVAVGPIENRSRYLAGALPDGEDLLARQAKALLLMHLKLTGRFVVVDREALDETARDAVDGRDLPGVAIAATITEFGLRTSGGSPALGLLDAGAKHAVHVTVALHVVDERAAQVVYTVQGAGEYRLTDRELAGFGTRAGYDASLNGKMLNRPIMQAVDALVAGLERGEWSPVGSSLRGR